MNLRGREFRTDTYLHPTKVSDYPTDQPTDRPIDQLIWPSFSPSSCPQTYIRYSIDAEIEAHAVMQPAMQVGRKNLEFRAPPLFPTFFFIQKKRQDMLLSPYLPFMTFSCRRLLFHHSMSSQYRHR